MALGGAEDGHDGVADEFIEHAALLGQGIDHQGEIFVEQADDALRSQLFGQGGEAADVGEEDGGLHRLAAQEVRARGQQLVGQGRVHIAGHGGLHALFRGDILDHHHLAELLVGGVGQGHDGDIHRQGLRAHMQLGIDQNLVMVAAVHCLQFVQHPAIVTGEEVFSLFADDVLLRHLKDAHTGDVAGHDRAILAQGDDAVGHRFQDALVVVLDGLNVVEQLGVFQADGDLRGKGLQPRLVIAGESPAAFVQHLGDADDLAVLIADRHAQDRAGKEAGLTVKGRIEAQIGIGVGDVDALARGEDRAGNAQMVGQADGGCPQALADFGIKLVGLFIIDEQGRAFGVQQAGDGGHDLLQQRPQLQFRTDLGDHP